MIPKTVKFRRTRQADLIEAFMLVMRTSHDLRRKRGLPTSPVKPLKQPPPLLVHILKTDPDGSFVAVDPKGKLVGFTMALIREEEWFLAFLFVDPAYQSLGVGQKLLAKALNYGKKNNCTRRVLVTFATNPQAVAVYTKMGMPPQRPLLSMERTRKDEQKFRLLRPPVKLEVIPLTNERLINRLTAMDRKARQLARPEEHFYWLGDPNYEVLSFRLEGRLVGYAVVSTRGMIAPVVATKPEYLSSMMAEAVNWGVRKGHKYQIIFPQGGQTEIMRMLLSVGFKIDEATLLMASEPISDPSIYIPATLAHF